MKRLCDNCQFELRCGCKEDDHEYKLEECQHYAALVELQEYKSKNPISNLRKEVHKNAIEHGWWDGEERSFGELIALCHSELTEALEEYRKGKFPTETYYSYEDEFGKMRFYANNPNGNFKPEGIPIELADEVIRIMDMCEKYGIDLYSAIVEKHEYNKSRPYKHGGKVI